MTHSHHTPLLTALLAGFASSLITCLMIMSYQVWADEGDEDTLPGGFAYNGYLDQNGTPFDGTVGMTFALYPSATDGASLWQETQTVEVYGGRFSVLLADDGDNPLPANIFQQGNPWLAVTVNGTPLGGRQQLHAVPASLWSRQGNNFTITGAASVASNLSVGGNAAVGGDAAVGGTLAVDFLTPETNTGITINAPVVVTDSFSAPALTPTPGTIDAQTAAGGVYDDNEALVVLGRRDPIGIDPRRVKLQQDVDVAGVLEVEGDLVVNGRVKSSPGSFGLNHHDCRWEDAPPESSDGDKDDTFHSGTCSAGYWMVGWRCYASDRLDSDCALYCCRF